MVNIWCLVYGHEYNIYGICKKCGKDKGGSAIIEKV